jgi:rhodanese-related sulfurtransferase
MLNTLKQLFGFAPKVDFAQLVNDGAAIIDVRSKAEYLSGHIKGSINIPLDVLTKNLNKLKNDKPIITCCASGMRSAAAKNILKANGFTEVHNGGGWYGLQKKINKL